MDLVTIEANVRKETGKNANRKLRKTGKIPGVILDKGKTTMIELDIRNLLSKAVKSKEKKFNLKLGNDVKPVVIKELQFDTVKRTAFHVDLMYV